MSEAQKPRTIWTLPYDQQLESLKAEGHAVTPKSDGMLDECNCTCGWTSGPYFDGYEYAVDAAQKHIEGQSR